MKHLGIKWNRHVQAPQRRIYSFNSNYLIAFVDGQTTRIAKSQDSRIAKSQDSRTAAASNVCQPTTTPVRWQFLLVGQEAIGFGHDGYSTLLPTTQYESKCLLRRLPKIDDGAMCLPPFLLTYSSLLFHYASSSSSSTSPSNSPSASSSSSSINKGIQIYYIFTQS